MDNQHFISWNCNGLQPHLPELLNYLENNTNIPLIICLQESNLHTKILPDIPNYSCINTPRPNNNVGGGTAIYIKTNVQYIRHLFCSELDPDIEYTSITIDYNNTSLTITTMYIRPQAHVNIEKLSKIKLENNHMILGDLNGKHTLWGSPYNDPRGTVIYKFIESNNLFCSVSIVEKARN